jgi:hydroxysqualene synthase
VSLASLSSQVTRKSRSNFFFAFLALPRHRRDALYAVYAFCRTVDDIADGAAPAAEKRRFLSQWREEIGRLDGAPETTIGRELARAVRAFGLPPSECHALLDGMETDSADRVRFSSDAELGTYVRRVAGSVGVLSVHLFGAPDARDFALDLGRTLQLVNILRDVDEDAALDRVYVPLSRLRLEDAPAHLLIADPRFAQACRDLADEAQAGFAAAERSLDRLDRARLKPAILMMESYRRILDRLQARGWGARRGKLRLTAGDRLQLLTLALRTA